MPSVSINGTNLFYVTAGEGFPCLVMHGGLGVDHTYLYPTLNPLGDKLHLVYYDHRGNGRSGRPPKNTMTHAQFAMDAEALVQHLGFEKVAVIGHSYGGFIALEFALRFPHRLSHLILFDTAPAFDYFDEILENALKMGATDEMIENLKTNYSTDEDFRKGMEIIQPLYFKNFAPEIAKRLFKNTIFNANGDAAEGELEAYNMVPRLNKIQIPTLILAGRYDFICPPSQATILHKGIANSKMVIFENSGHIPAVEEPEAFFSTVLGWIDKTTGQIQSES
jgi:proline iminopeptidase